MKYSILILALIFAADAATAQTKLSSFGGSCASQGPWTKTALKAAEDLEHALEAFQNDPKCGGIEKVITSLDPIEGVLQMPQDQQLGARLEAIPAEMQSLFQVARQSPQSTGAVADVMGKVAIEGAALGARASEVGKAPGVLEKALNLSNYFGFGNRSQKAANGAPKILKEVFDRLGSEKYTRAATEGAGIMAKVFDRMPFLDECLVARPSQAAALVSAGVRVASAFAQSGETAVTSLASSMASFVTFLKNSRFSKVRAELAKTEYWSSLQCFLETLTEVQCATEDTRTLLEWYKKEVGPTATVVNGDYKVELENPLTGFNVLVHAVPKVTDWLQKVLLAVQPRLEDDAVFKNQALDTVTDTVKEINRLWGEYHESVAAISTLGSDPIPKRSRVYQLLLTLTSSIIRKDQNSKENFFLTTISPGYLPFFLIGRSEIPKEVRANSEGRATMEWDKYIEGDGTNYIPEFTNPEDLLAKIGERLMLLTESALDKATAYFNQFLIIDESNLAVDTTIDTNFTVLESLEAIYDYCGGLEQQVIRGVKANEPLYNPIVLPNLRETRLRIYQVVRLFQPLRELSKSACGTDSACADRLIFRKDVYQAYKNIVEAAYEHFNVMLQRNSFFNKRMSTFVMYDYALRLRQGTKLNNHEQKLMRHVGTNLMLRMTEVYGKDPSVVWRDVHSATDINAANLQAFETAFGDTFAAMIAEYDYLAQGPKTSRDLQFHTVARRLRDAGLITQQWSAFDPNVLNKPLYYLGALFRLRTIDNGRYPYYGYKNEVPRAQDNRFGVIAQMKARLCVQSLAFKKSELYSRFCKGTVLEGQFKGLAMKYDDFMVRGQTVSETKRVCALHDFYRNNFVKEISSEFTLLQKFIREEQLTPQ
ncbi:MAG: hypothetical protein ABL958_02055 [Bdellovibrionia bacterium]